jgi:2-polyprenyl-3-methyl-5-hydroxy-6-metoxy-1,4-benzoquinol methylase
MRTSFSEFQAGAAKACMLLNWQIDVTSILRSVRVPTLVLHRRTDVRGAVEPRSARLGDLCVAYYRPLYDAVLDRLLVSNGTRLLDTGCGPGGAALIAASRGACLAGLDVARESVEFARERLPKGDFQIGDMEALPGRTASTR